MDESPAGGFEGRKTIAGMAAALGHGLRLCHVWHRVGRNHANAPPAFTGGRRIDITYKPRAYLRACSFSLPPRSAAISARLRSTPSGARLLLNAV